MRPLALALLFAAAANAQDAAIVVETAAPEALVLVDGVRVGAPGDVLPVASGARAVALVEARAGWDARRTERAVTLGAGDTLTLRLELPVRTRIESLPLRAEVALVRADGSREALGRTPLVIDREGGLDGRLVASLDGHADAETAAPAAGGRVSLLLRPEGAAPEAPLPHALPTQRRNPARTALDVGLAAAALAAGAVAVHYKFQADAADSAYRDRNSLQRGQPALRDEALRNDRLSGVALGVSTASLGVLAIRLAIR